MSLSENEVIKLASKYFNTKHPDLIKGIGDDCAVIKGSNQKLSLLTSDMLVEDNHFLIDKMPPYDLGWKSLAVNISDIASMGGKPDFALLSLGLGKKINSEWLEQFYQGLAECSQKYNCSIIGGDTVSSGDKTIINISLMGSTNKPVYRTGILADFVLVTTGYHGFSGLGLQLLLQDKHQEFDNNIFRQKHFLPIPRVAEAEFLSQQLKSFAMMDSSDGLFQAVNFLARENKLGFVFEEKEKLISSEFKRKAEELNLDSWFLTLYGGEDYELIIALSKADYERIQDPFSLQFQQELILIGHFTSKTDKVLSSEGSEVKDKTYQHFK
jgi:thiamine-monophosphate kinase